MKLKKFLKEKIKDEFKIEKVEHNKNIAFSLWCPQFTTLDLTKGEEFFSITLKNDCNFLAVMEKNNGKFVRNFTIKVK